MSSEFCSKCRRPTTMNVTTSKEKRVGKDGKPVVVETRSYHCGTCRTFVRSEEVGAESSEKDAADVTN